MGVITSVSSAIFWVFTLHCLHALYCSGDPQSMMPHLFYWWVFEKKLFSHPRKKLLNYMLSNFLWHLIKSKKNNISKRVKQKTSLNLRNSFCSISPVTNMIESWDIIHLKSEILSSVWSTKLFCTIAESWVVCKIILSVRFKAFNKSNIFKSDTATIFSSFL